MAGAMDFFLTAGSNRRGGVRQESCCVFPRFLLPSFLHAALRVVSILLALPSHQRLCLIACLIMPYVAHPFFVPPFTQYKTQGARAGQARSSSMADVDPRIQDTQDEATDKLINEEYKYVTCCL